MRAAATQWARSSHAVTALLLCTIFGGVATDALANSWSQQAANIWAWCAYLFLLFFSREDERKELITCLVIATLGEIFLGFVWGLYEYRLHNLPLFIPAGHGVVFAAAQRITKAMPAWLPYALGAALAPLAAIGGIFGYDTQAALWFGVFILCVMVSRDKRFPATMFLFALLIESLGTSAGAWQYFGRDPWFGLTTVTKPPLWAGTFYCVLDTFVALVAVKRTARVERHGLISAAAGLSAGLRDRGRSQFRRKRCRLHATYVEAVLGPIAGEKQIVETGIARIEPMPSWPLQTKNVALRGLHIRAPVLRVQACHAAGAAGIDEQVPIESVGIGGVYA